MKTTHLILNFEYSLSILYSVFCLGCSRLYITQDNCTGVCAGLEDSSEIVTDSSHSDYSSSTEVDIHKLESSLRFPTVCETPNHEASYCMEISQCPVLNNVKGKKKYAEFVEASRCGPANENQDNFKVCCGRYNCFRNFSKANDAKDSKALPQPSPPLPEDITVFPKKCGTQKHIMRGRIVGGMEASLGEYPWMARLIHKNDYGQKSYGCAGFLIHTKYVVTAGHCIKSEFTKIKGDPYSVLLGEHNVTTIIDCSPGGTFCADPVQVSRINKIVVHPQYDRLSKAHHNDIALIHLKKAIRVTEYVQPICLLNEENPNIRKYYLSGWGRTETSEYSPVKLKVDLVAYDLQQCKDKFNEFGFDITDTQICAGGEKLKDGCNGDSGGPLMFNNGSHFFAAGLVSYGIGCGMEGWPGIYTSLPSYIDWIKLQIVDISTRSPKIKKNRKKNKKKAKLLASLEASQTVSYS